MAMNESDAVSAHSKSTTASFASNAATSTPASSKQTDDDLNTDNGHHDQYPDGAEPIKPPSFSKLIHLVEHKCNEIMTAVKIYDRVESDNFRLSQKTLAARSDDANAAALHAMEHRTTIIPFPSTSSVQSQATASLVFSERYAAEKRATAVLKQLTALYEARDDAARE